MSAVQTNPVSGLAGALAGALSLVFLLAATACSGAQPELELLPVTLSPEPAIESNALDQEAIGDGVQAIQSSISEALPAPQVQDDKTARRSVLVIIEGGGKRGEAIQSSILEARSAPQVEDGKKAPKLTEVIIEGGKEVPSLTPSQLVAASRREKKRRANIEPVAVITNQNLKESGIGGQVTFATGASPSAAADSDQPGRDAVQKARVEEEYWRSGTLEVRLSWKAAVNETIDLQAEVARLRRRFYAEDDPHYRDNEIKPAWDRALERLAATRREAEDHRQRLTEFLQRGRAAGALPGWLREGLEYEPAPTDDLPRRRDDPNEPQIVDEDRWIEP